MVDLQAYLQALITALRRVYGGPAPENVRAQAERVRALAEELAARTDKGRNDL